MRFASGCTRWCRTWGLPPPASISRASMPSHWHQMVVVSSHIGPKAEKGNLKLGHNQSFCVTRMPFAAAPRVCALRLPPRTRGTPKSLVVQAIVRHALAARVRLWAIDTSTKRASESRPVAIWRAINRSTPRKVYNLECGFCFVSTPLGSLS